MAKEAGPIIKAFMVQNICYIKGTYMPTAIIPQYLFLMLISREVDTNRSVFINMVN